MSYAIIRTGGKQYRAEPGKSLRIPSLPGDLGTQVEFNEVLLGSDGTSVRAGVPTLIGAKIVVFKFRRRKNYAKKQGHRQGFTEIKVRDITLG
jgi:large subunit ribosomal protein L21